MGFGTVASQNRIIGHPTRIVATRYQARVDMAPQSRASRAGLLLLSSLEEQQIREPEGRE